MQLLNKKIYGGCISAQRKHENGFPETVMSTVWACAEVDATVEEVEEKILAELAPNRYLDSEGWFNRQVVVDDLPNDILEQEM